MLERNKKIISEQLFEIKQNPPTQNSELEHSHKKNQRKNQEYQNTEKPWKTRKNLFSQLKTNIRVGTQSRYCSILNSKKIKFSKEKPGKPGKNKI